LAPTKLPAVPRGQSVQEDRLTKPLDPPHEPLGQGAGAVAPPRQKYPSGQSVPAALVDPSSHPNPAAAVQGVQEMDPPAKPVYVPLGHRWHSSREPAPGLAEYRPVGQPLQVKEVVASE
jgi:hypothetical protein